MGESEELEGLLRRYRPSAPPPELRARMIDGVARRGEAVREPVDVPPRRWTLLEWMPAAAALVAAITLSALAAGVRAEFGVDSFGDAEREAVLKATVRALGGDQAAQDSAERLLALDERLRFPPNSPWGGDGGAHD